MTQQYGFDSFIRANNASSWGTASDGQTWTQVGGTDTLSISSNKGVVTANGSASSNRILLGVTTTGDCEGLVRITVGATTNDSAGLIWRSDASAANHYLFRYSPSSTTNTEIAKRVSGSLSTLTGGSAGFTYSSGSLIWFRFRMVGNTIWVRAWLDGTSESSANWNSYTDSSPLSAGYFGLYSSGVPTTPIKFDSFYLVDYATSEVLTITETVSRAPTFTRTESVTLTESLTLTPSLTWSGAPRSSDSFQRANNPSSWGTASDGETWTQVAGNDLLSISGNQGVIVNNNGSGVADRLLLGSGSVTDAEGLVRVTVGSTLDTMGILLRSDATSANHYVGRLPPNNPTQLEIGIRVAGSFSSLGLFSSGFTLTSGMAVWLRFRAQGSLLLLKAWPDGMPEPLGFAVVTDTTFVSGQYGLYCTGFPIAAAEAFDHFSVTVPPFGDTLLVTETLALQSTFRVIELLFLSELLNPVARPTPTLLAGPGFAGLGVLPLTTAPILPYSINGTVLDTQPTIMTAPVSTMQFLTTGTRFVLGFLSPSVATLAAITSSAPVTLQFGLSDGSSVTGTVQLQTTQIGAYFHVVVTILQTIAIYRWVIPVQFS